MNIRDLMLFQTIVREKGLTKASKMLYMTPQGLSRVIKNLENELNCQLLVRTSSGIELTESGTCLSEYADRITADYEQLRNEHPNVSRLFGSCILKLSSTTENIPTDR